MNKRNLLSLAVVVGSGLLALAVYMNGRSGKDPSSSAADAGLVVTTTFEKVESDAGSQVAKASRAKAQSISPRLISNASDYPVTVFGEGLVAGMVLELYYTDALHKIPTTFVDDRHLTALIPSGLAIKESKPLDDYRVRLVSADKTPAQGALALTVINDTGYPLPRALHRTSAGAVYAASVTTDELKTLGGGSVPTLDRPVAIASYKDSVVVLHETEGTLLLVREGAELRRIDGPKSAQDLAVDEETGRAYVTSRFTDSVHIIDLEAGTEIGRHRVGINPGPIVIAGNVLAIGNTDSGELTVIGRSGGSATTKAPEPGMPIVGGRSAALSPYIMGGTAPRDLVYSGRLAKVFVANVGPNIGPNPKRVEVSTNGGVTVFDVETGTFVRHVSMLRGVPTGLALDDERGLLYAADIATGRVVVFDANKLAGPDGQGAVLGSVDIPAPAGILRLQPADQLGVDGRSSDALHSGPRALVLSEDGLVGWVLTQFTGRVVELDLAAAPSGTLKVVGDEVAFPLGKQTQRRAGEVAFTTDLANSGLTCETCHLDGRGEGVVLTKGAPNHHIYRVSNLRGVRETPPYFTPSFYKSLPASSGFLSHIRYQNPPANAKELAALTAHSATLVAPPNPYRDKGVLPNVVTLADGVQGHPLEGMRLFEGKAECATCHPAPTFSTDQDTATRGKTHAFDTPRSLALRPEMQDKASYPLAAPALVGVWDSFPLLHSGAAGFEVRGETLATSGAFPLRQVFKRGAGHGKMGELETTEVNDLLAYLSTL